MAFSVNDDTAGTQRIGASNAGGVELGSSAAGSSLSVHGNQILDGSSLAANRIPPAGLSRVTGSVTITSRNASVVSTGVVAGFGKVSGAILVRFDYDNFTCALNSTSTGIIKTCSYSVF